MILSIEAFSKEIKSPYRIAVFRAQGFPTVDSESLSYETIDKVLEGFEVQFLSSIKDLNHSLKRSNFDLFILPYGSAFPVQAWDSIRDFLGKGGNFINLGGAPFHQPVLMESNENKNRWILSVRQPTWARELLVGPAEAFDLNPAGRFSILNVEENGWERVKLPVPSRIFELVVRFSTRKELEKEDGSSGPREGLLRPLVHIVDSSGIPRFSPLIEIDRLLGNSAGGRWIFWTADVMPDSKVIKKLVGRALEGASEIKVIPTPACIEKGENLSIRVSIRMPKIKENKKIPEEANLIVKNEKGHKIFSGKIELRGSKHFKTGSLIFRSKVEIKPGFYKIEVSLPESPFNPSVSYSGFWVKDKEVLSRSPRLTVSRDWIIKDGKVFPLIGTTYMASDVHRKFAFEPNPFLWNRDFERMERAGVNFVRTGIWTGWTRAMLDSGAIDENFLRSLEAFVLTAAKHKIIVCFTFFSFLPPPSWSQNPYLDPSAIEWQRAFITLIVEHFKNCGWIHYDLINEPSYAPFEYLWENRPFYDEFEKDAWRNWVCKRHGCEPALLSILWRDSLSPLSLPQKNEFHYSPSIEDKKFRKVMDFHLFSQDVFSGWANRLREIIKKVSPDSLVTVGQDEGGTTFRPSPQFHWDSVDYTCVHTWWNNSDLLWDGLMAKVPEKPNLVQETGIMRLEDMDGNLWRTAEDSAKLLERKLAYAFASRSAGAVQWIWNINPYQPIDNEAVIGIFRPDGTAKPELDVLEKFSSFLKKIEPYLEDYEQPEVFVIIPHSRIFSHRPLAIESVKRVVKVLSDYFGVIPCLISEHRLSFERIKNARLIIISNPEILHESACDALLKSAVSGVKLLFTGAVTGDSYGRLPESLKKLGIFDHGIPVSIREETGWGKDGYLRFVSFDRGEIEWIKKSSKPLSFEGNIWNEPLPVELAREEEPLIHLLKKALEKSGVSFSLYDFPITTSVFKTSSSILVIFINESSSDIIRRISIEGREYDFWIPKLRPNMILIERRTGKILFSYIDKNEGDAPHKIIYLEDSSTSFPKCK